MRSAIVAAAFAGVVAAVPQGVTSAISPQGTAPAGCSASAPGTFQITVTNVTSNAKRSLEARDVLSLTLANGILKDSQSRIGYIASNYQFQFDGPPQAGAIFTAGWSLCGNGSLALGSKAIFYQCLSGDFYNLYDRSWAAQCSPIYISAIGTSSGSSGSNVGQIPDGQLQKISQIADGQIQLPTASPPKVSQIGDGQPQAPKVTPTPTGKPVTVLPDGQPGFKPSSAAPPKVSQIGDGQIQAPVANKTTTAPVTQFTGAASNFAAPVAAVAGLFAAIALL